jgi:transcription antitermination factor NusG
MPLSAPFADAHRWYALQTRPKHEKTVSTLLEGKGYEQFLPLYQNWHRSSGRLKSVMLPLFPGYVFCRFDQYRRLPILTTPGVFAIVSRGRVPESVPDEEIAAVQASCAAQLPVTPWPYLERGDAVLVEVGALRGVQGIFVSEKGTGRLVLSINMLRRSVAVEMDRDWVRPVNARVA